jgi:predicted DCC family thiol-disulfide oxidoreductase YuxK
MNQSPNPQKQIILFDGVCNFCNYWVNFIMARDKYNVFKFAALQSEKGMELFEKFNLPEYDFDSFILISQGNVYKKSSAAFEIFKYLSGWPIIFAQLRFLPRALTDFIYDIVAKNRYKFFGKNETCRIPTAQEENKFL